jgi:hypothetical protein
VQWLSFLFVAREFLSLKTELHILMKTQTLRFSIRNLASIAYVNAIICVFALAFNAALANPTKDALDSVLIRWVQSMDENRDGGVDRDELQRHMKRINEMADRKQTAQPLQMFILGFSTMDRDGNGKLNAAEISAGVNTRFENADRNHNGKLTMDEASSGMPMVARNFTAIDIGTRGEISLQQVRDFMATTMSRMPQR